MNYYDILTVCPESTTVDIKQHYYRLAKKYHPDKQNGDLEKQEYFKQLSEAYTTLSNPKKRYLYDIQLAVKDLDSVDRLSFLKIKFTDEELLLLHSYYMRVRNSTEVRFLKLLFKSFPDHLKQRIHRKIHRKINELNPEHGPPSTPDASVRCTVLTDVSHQRIINCEKLTETYRIQLHRTLSDVYENQCKEIRIALSDRVWILFITHSDYRLTFMNNGFPLVLSIETVEYSDYHLDGHDLHTSYESNLYEHYYIRYQRIVLPHKQKCVVDKQNCVLENMGLKDPLTNRRGKLIIHQKLNLILAEEYLEKYQEVIKQVFSRTYSNEVNKMK